MRGAPPPNCTLVELKYVFNAYSSNTTHTPNCTLVELKWINLLQQSRTLVSKLYLSGIEIMGRGDSVLLS